MMNRDNPYNSEEFNQDSILKNTLPLPQKNSESRKLVRDLKEAVKLSGLEDGMTISFHHHFRDGDHVVNMVLDLLSEMGFKNLGLNASSLTGGQKNLVKHIESGLITRIEASGIHGALGEYVSTGNMEMPVIFRSHGGRAYAIAKGEAKIDVAFLGAPSSDAFGNALGYVKSENNDLMCGSLGYAMVDAMYAKKTIIITNNLVNYPNTPFSIPEHHVDYVVYTDKPVGNPSGIKSGTTRSNFNVREDLIGEKCAEIIEASGYLENGFSMQMGSGGASLAVAGYIRERMVKKDIKAAFALGGITAATVKMHEEGLIERLLDVQSFDLEAARSIKENKFHQEISAIQYASIGNKSSAVEKLDFVVLSGLEVDVDFNVNALTGSDGLIMGALGGHPDTAAGASLTIIAIPLTRGRIPCVVNKVLTVVTPGNTVDVIVTDHGIAVNPLRKDLTAKLKDSGIKLTPIEELKYKAEKITGKPKPIEFKEKIVGIVNYRDNSIIDRIKQVK
jgi:citrate lyase subunit alpha/citrate CoA-transferase